MERRSIANGCPLWVALLAGCAAADAKHNPTDKPEVLVEVAVVTVQAEQVALQSQLAGRTAPFRSAEVRPQVTGIIKSRLFREGANVKAGEVLYQIEPS